MRPLVCALLFVACGDSATTDTDTQNDADTGGEVEDLTGRSLYRLETEVNGQPLVLDRELTGNPQYFAFGSSHIAPAVALAMTDSVTFPRTVTVSINFGIVIASETRPVHTDSARTYTFSASPPGVDVFVAGLQYRSTLDGATGQIDVTEWSVETGQPVAGTFSGTLVADGNPARTLPVSGNFYFTLPDRNSGQPR